MAKGTIYARLLVLMTSVIIISVVTVAGLAYHIARQSNLDNARTYAHSLLDHQRSMMDKELAVIRSLATNMLMTQSYMYSKWGNGLAVSALIDLSRYLEQQKDMSPYILSIYLYYNELGHVITSEQGVKYVPFDTFADREWHETEAWGSNQKSFWLTGRTALTQDGEKEAISIVQKFPLVGMTSGAIVINLDREKLFADYVGQGEQRLGSTLVLGAGGEEIYGETSDMAQAFVQEKADASTGAGVSYDTRLLGEPILVTRTESQVAGWQYVHLIPHASLLQNMSSIRYIVWGFSLFYMIVAIVAAMLLSRSIYKPLHAIVTQLSGRQKRGMRSGNEANLIRHVFDEVSRSHETALREKREVERLLSQNRELFKERLLQEMFTPGAQRRELDGAYAEALGIALPQEAFALLLVELEEDDVGLHVQAYRLLHELRPLVRGEAFVAGGRRIAIVQLEPSGGTAATEQLAGAIRDLSLSKLGLMCSFGMSVGHEAGEWGEALAEAEEALNYTMYVGRGELLAYGSLREWGGGRTPFHYPYALEQRLAEHLRQGDRSAVEARLDELFAVIMEKRPGQQTVFQLFIRMCGEVVKTVQASGHTLEEVLGDDFRYTEGIHGARTLPEMKAFLQSLCQRILDYRQEKSSRIHEETLQKAVAFMESAYQDAVSVDRIAEHVRLSPSYISRLFKEAFGMTINDYLIQLRIERAKQLLLETDVTVEEICQSVGYNTISYFTKLFKAKTGMTPGQFRKAMPGGEN